MAVGTDAAVFETFECSSGEFVASSASKSAVTPRAGATASRRIVSRCEAEFVSASVSALRSRLVAGVEVPESPELAASGTVNAVYSSEGVRWQANDSSGTARAAINRVARRRPMETDVRVKAILSLAETGVGHRARCPAGPAWGCANPIHRIVAPDEHGGRFCRPHPSVRGRSADRAHGVRSVRSTNPGRQRASSHGVDCAAGVNTLSVRAGRFRLPVGRSVGVLPTAEGPRP